MTDSDVDIAEWLLQQIAEDAMFARAATQNHWEIRHFDDDRFMGAIAVTVQDAAENPEHNKVVALTLMQSPRSVAIDDRRWEENAHHIANWGPVRVIAECESKRRIIALHRRTERLGWVDDGCELCAVGSSCDCCLDREDLQWPCQTLKLLALPYANRDGYREEWRA